MDESEAALVTLPEIAREMVHYTLSEADRTYTNNALIEQIYEREELDRLAIAALLEEDIQGLPREPEPCSPYGRGTTSSTLPTKIRASPRYNFTTKRYDK